MIILHLNVCLGFKEALDLGACCGYGGLPLNFDGRIACGETKVLNGSMVTTEACNNTTEYVNRDGNYYNKAANQYVSSQILSGKYLDPPPPTSSTSFLSY